MKKGCGWGVDREFDGNILRHRDPWKSRRWGCARIFRGIEGYCICIWICDVLFCAFPRSYHRLLSAKALGWCAQSRRFLFHKDTCCNTKGILDKIAATAIEGTPFRFYNANMATLKFSIEKGTLFDSKIIKRIWARSRGFLGSCILVASRTPCGLVFFVSILIACR